MPEEPASEGEGPDPEKKQEAESLVKRALEAGGTQDSSTIPQDLQYLLEKLQAQEIALKKTYANQELSLRSRYATGLIYILVVQLLIADAVFVVYAWHGKHWVLSTAVIDTWLGATVVQIIGVVLVVTQHLFPRRDKQF